MKEQHNVHARMEKVRHALRLHKLPKWARVFVVSLVGGLSLVAGVAMIFMPGPAIVFIPLGLFLLASEFQWAERWAQKLVDSFDRLRAKWRAWRKQRSVAAKS